MNPSRYFNTSGPNIPKEHYTLMRPELIQKGLDLVNHSRYFTIWAPRQTGKSTYFRLLMEELKSQNYLVAHINVENFLSATEKSFLKFFTDEWNAFSHEKIKADSFSVLYKKIKDINTKKCVFIIDEIEGLNPEIFGQFLHTIRNLYHSRETHCLKCVILVGVSNILGIVQDHASPFKIADNLDIDYFTKEEVFELLHQHEIETGQIFENKIKEKIYEITAGQPGLVNGFGKKLTDVCLSSPKITYEDYLKVEDWYLRKAIDKNISNIINKAKLHKGFVEKLLFTETKEPFRVNKPAIKELYANGLINEDEDGHVKFWVPLYKKCLYDAFYPYTNGENEHILGQLIVSKFFTPKGKLNIGKFIANYKEFVKRRGFKPFREKDEKGNFTSIKEAALLYSFETYIYAFVQEAKGKCYREADTGLGKSDLIVNIKNNEFLIEGKKYYSFSQFTDGKEKLAYYCHSLGLKQGVYLVYVPRNKYPKEIKEAKEKIHKIEIQTYLIIYDEEKDF